MSENTAANHPAVQQAAAIMSRDGRPVTIETEPSGIAGGGEYVTLRSRRASWPADETVQVMLRVRGSRARFLGGWRFAFREQTRIRTWTDLEVRA